MYSILHDLLADKKGGEIFVLFGGWHFFYMGVAAALIAFVLLRNHKRDGRWMTGSGIHRIPVHRRRGGPGAGARAESEKKSDFNNFSLKFGTSGCRLGKSHDLGSSAVILPRVLQAFL